MCQDLLCFCGWLPNGARIIRCAQSVLKLSRRTVYFSFLSKVPANEPPPGSPTGSLWRLRPVYRAFCISQKPHLSGSPVKLSSIKVHFMESLAERCPTTTALHHLSKSPLYEPPPHIPGSPRMEMSPNGERCPYPETFLKYIPGYPVKELLPKPPPRNLFKERCSIPRPPFIQLSKSPVDDLSSRFPKRGSYGKRCPSPSFCFNLDKFFYFYFSS